MLAQMMQLDGEDGTINTRLARRDIDSMFCSPSASPQPPAPLAAPAPVLRPHPGSDCAVDGGEGMMSMPPPLKGSTATASNKHAATASLGFQIFDDCNTADAPFLCSSSSSIELGDAVPARNEVPHDPAPARGLLMRVRSGSDGTEGDNPSSMTGAAVGAAAMTATAAAMDRGVLKSAVHRPFGTLVEQTDSMVYSGLKEIRDLSAIKEVGTSHHV